jgi:hypothetical protein
VFTKKIKKDNQEITESKKWFRDTLTKLIGWSIAVILAFSGWLLQTTEDIFSFNSCCYRNDSINACFTNKEYNVFLKDNKIDEKFLINSLKKECENQKTCIDVYKISDNEKENLGRKAFNEILKHLLIINKQDDKKCDSAIALFLFTVIFLASWPYSVLYIRSKCLNHETIPSWPKTITFVIIIVFVVVIEVGFALELIDFVKKGILLEKLKCVFSF